MYSCKTFYLPRPNTGAVQSDIGIRTVTYGPLASQFILFPLVLYLFLYLRCFLEKLCDIYSSIGCALLQAYSLYVNAYFSQLNDKLFSTEKIQMISITKIFTFKVAVS